MEEAGRGFEEARLSQNLRQAIIIIFHSGIIVEGTFSRVTQKTGGKSLVFAPCWVWKAKRKNKKLTNNRNIENFSTLATWNNKRALYFDPTAADVCIASQRPPARLLIATLTKSGSSLFYRLRLSESLKSDENSSRTSSLSPTHSFYTRRACCHVCKLASRAFSKYIFHQLKNYWGLDEKKKIFRCRNICAVCSREWGARGRETHSQQIPNILVKLENMLWMQTNSLHDDKQRFASAESVNGCEHVELSSRSFEAGFGVPANAVNACRWLLCLPTVAISCWVSADCGRRGWMECCIVKLKA